LRALRDEKEAFLELQHASSYRRCRGKPGLVGAVVPSKKAVAIAEPTMKKHPSPTKLSEVSGVIELLLSYADVDFFSRRDGTG
jgi:hypothetical protein